MRTILAAAAALLVIGCGAQPGGGPGSGSSDLGTVTGHVLAVPCAPVERIGSPCPGRPVAQAEVDVKAQASGTVTRATTDAAGQYAVRVAPGTYVVSLATTGGLRRALQGPKTVNVTGGATVKADFTIDSGIR